MVFCSGLLVSCFASGKADVIWGMAALCVLIVAADTQAIYPQQGSEATIGSLVVAKPTMVSWDMERVLSSLLLVIFGILAGLGLKRAAKGHSQRGTWAKKMGVRSPFLSVFQVLGTFLLCKASFVILRDLNDSATGYRCFTLYPLHAVVSDDSIVVALASSVGMLILGFFCGLQARHWRKRDAVGLVASIASLVVLDVTLSMEWRFNSLGGDSPVLGMLVASGILGLGSALGLLTARTARSVTEGN